MRLIQLKEGYMVCVTCRGYIDADYKSPICDCLEEELLVMQDKKQAN